MSVIRLTKFCVRACQQEAIRSKKREIVSELPVLQAYPFLIRSESHWLPGQRALPDVQQELFELVETVGPEFSAPVSLDLTQYLVDF